MDELVTQLCVMSSPLSFLLDSGEYTKTKTGEFCQNRSDG